MFCSKMFLIVEDKKCKFSCVSEERKEVFVMDENLPDGTPCSYENEDQICIQVLIFILWKQV